MSAWWRFVVDRAPELWFRAGEHIVLTGISTAAAIGIGVPLGILAASKSWLRTTVLGIVGIFQTVPSLALLAILLTLLGRIGAVPAVVALTVYALLPIVRNTVTGLDSVDDRLREAARGVGMNSWQTLRLVEVPLALPVIVAGIRTAAVVGVGIATLSAFIGAGGLGQFINRGLALSNSKLILLGAIPAAALAIVADLTIAGFAWGLKPVRSRHQNTWRPRLRPVALAMPLVLLSAGAIAVWPKAEPVTTASGHRPIRVGSKNFTEQLILAELISQKLEQAGVPVERQFNLGGTMICHEAIRAGELDIYVEYTGTALVSILEEEASRDSDRVLETVRNSYREKFDLDWMQPLGFSNTYAITVRQQTATDLKLTSVSDLVPHAQQLRAGWTPEFSERSDGYLGLRDAYRLKFSDVRDLDAALMYEAVSSNEVDVICAFSTDGRIDEYQLKTLTDDRSFFPPYDAVPVCRREVLEQSPKAKAVLNELANSINDETMRRLNHQVDLEGKSVDEVVERFLQEHEQSPNSQGEPGDAVAR